ncbi:MAG: glutathione-disulfide reductase [Alphaproteobacteria bacterium]
MPRYDFDLFTIGAGSGGVRASRLAGELGKRAAVVEQSRIGGTCVNRGCIPKKLYVYASRCAEDFEDAEGFGWRVVDASFDWSKLVAAKEKELARLHGIYRRLLEDAGVAYIEGRGVLIDPHTVKVGDKTFTAETVLVNTGARPEPPEIPGVQFAITSDEIFDLPELPGRLGIVGGGYIAVEFAGIFNGLGSETTLIYRGETILRGFDDDVRTTMCEEMAKKGVDLRLETNIEKIGKKEDGLHATTTHGETEVFDQILMATGRIPNTRGLGLVEAGVELSRNGAVVVDHYSRSSAQNVYAVGDCTDRLNLTPIAIHEAQCLIETLYNGNPTRPDHRDVPTTVFGQPSVGAVGFTEAEARAEFGAVDVYRAKFRPLKHTLTGRDEMTLMKLVVDAKTDRVVGAHMVGPDAGEVIQGVAIAVKARLTKAAFDTTMGIHPTAAEEFVQMREKVAEAGAEATE